MSAKCRAAAARVIAAVAEGGESLRDALPAELDGRDAAERPLLRQLCYGSLRHYHSLSAMLRPLLRKPLKRRDGDILALLVCGLYQLRETDIPAHAAVAATVEACRELDRAWATGLVNAVLRNCQRRGGALAQALRGAELASHPEWLFDAIHRAWPRQAEEILAANNQRAPMVLRHNRRHGARERYLRQLEERDIPAAPARLAEDGIVLGKPLDVALLPGFAEGRVSVQDQAAQLAAAALAPRPGERVLDTCAAPGGKACHLLESAPEIAELVAWDIDPGRLRQVEQNLARLRLRAKVLCVDATAAPAEHAAGGFDRILVDAPCSGSGVVRRHPDIKLLRRESDVARLAETQSRILASAWPLLKRGGSLLYATCSILPEENAEVVRRFLRRFGDAEPLALGPRWGLACSPGRQLLPSPGGCDGHYYALLGKR